MPDGFYGHVNPNMDGSYTILINAKLDYETQTKVYLHEVNHIKNGDFDKSDADSIEREAHKEGFY
jgi:hypothetical protein